MCWFKKKTEQLPEITKFGLHSDQISKEMAELDIADLYGRLDSLYGYTTLENWGKVFYYIYLTQEPPKYSVLDNGAWNSDCEDFAIWLKAMVSMHFGLNACAIVIGTIPEAPGGRHGFFMFRTEDGWWIKEPNPAFKIEEPFRPNDRHGYKPLFDFM